MPLEAVPRGVRLKGQRRREHGDGKHIDAQRSQSKPSA
jgi:hypothetical protein